jgi:hypothetical protein
MPIYRLWADSEGHTHLESFAAAEMPFEAGPGGFKGIGGTVLGDASRVMLVRLEPGATTQLHRVNPGLAVVLEGAATVGVSDGTEVALAPGDAVRIESAGLGRDGVGGWSLANLHPTDHALLALVLMPSRDG